MSRLISQREVVSGDSFEKIKIKTIIYSLLILWYVSYSLSDFFSQILLEISEGKGHSSLVCK